MDVWGCVGVFWYDLGLGLENGGSINILPHKGGGQGGKGGADATHPTRQTERGGCVLLFASGVLFQRHTFSPHLTRFWPHVR